MRRACGSKQICYWCLPTVSTVDGVTVRRGLSGVDNGVETEKRSAVMAGHAPESIGGAGQDGHGGREGGDRLHG
jgi:hypothetical protein